MTEPSLAIQKLLVERLKASNVLPWQTIFDRSGRPTVFPCIIVGSAYVNYPDYIDEFAIQVSADVHVWTEEQDLASVKTITSQVREALFHGPWAVDGHHCVNLRMEGARFLRDPDGIHSHGVLTFNAILQESVVL